MAHSNPGPDTRSEPARPDYLAVGAALAALSVALLVDQLRYRIAGRSRRDYARGYLHAVTEQQPGRGHIRPVS